MVAPRFMSGATYSFIFAFIKTIRLLRLLLANPRGHLGGKARGRDSPRQVLVHAQDMQMSTWTSQCNGHVPRGKRVDAVAVPLLERCGKQDVAVHDVLLCPRSLRGQESVA
jgi:hypothetical protein